MIVVNIALAEFWHLAILILIVLSNGWLIIRSDLIVVISNQSVEANLV